MGKKLSCTEDDRVVVVKTPTAHEEDIREYVHKKTGNRYVKLGIAINATNAQDGQIMVLYQKKSKKGSLFIREESEFCEKFIPVDKWGELTSKLTQLADACSDLIYGGESGWENVIFNTFVGDCRKYIGYGVRAKAAKKVYERHAEFCPEHCEEETEDQNEESLPDIKDIQQSTLSGV